MKKHISILHPDLGIGGAERLIIDIALSLHTLGYEISIITNHHDKSHCFEESLNEWMNVKVVANWFPRSIFGRMMALCAYIHLLLTNKDTTMKKIYRAPIDYIEEFSTGCATKVLLNSKFTVDVFKKTFKSLSHMNLDVLYPIANTESLKIFDFGTESRDRSFNVFECREMLPVGLIPSCQFLILSINRYERKKKLELALYSLKYLLVNWKILVDSSLAQVKPSQVHLVIVGGYDARVQENVSYHNELTRLCEELMIYEHVTFLRSCPSEMKPLLIGSSDVILYTPENEHFGIVPVEAMYLSRPVIGLNCGGPKETIVNGQTGFLCEPNSLSVTSQAIAEHLSKFINDPDLSKRMGEAGHRRVIEQFSPASFQKQLEHIVLDMLNPLETKS